MKKKIKYLIFIILFFIFHQTAYTQPSNDKYTNPIVLTKLDNWCSYYGQYTNVNATADTFSGPTCWSSNPAHDVWFKFTAIASAVNVGIYGSGSDGGTLMYPRLALCSIDAASNLLYIGTACNEASYFPGFTSIYTSSLVIGNSYYIRVDGAQDYTGSIELCVNNFTPSVKPGDDCSTAAYLCNKNTVTQVALSGWDDDTAEVNNSCMDYMPGLVSGSGGEEDNAVWYTFTIARSGILTFSINPNNNLDDIDFGLYHVTLGNCSTLQSVRCSCARCYNDSGIIGPTGLRMTSIDTSEEAGCGDTSKSGNWNWVKYLKTKAGDSYALLLNNCSDVEPGTDNGFTISFGGSCEFAGPVADFDDSIVSSCQANNSVIITDKSVGATSYNWNFGESAIPPNADSEGPFTVSYSTAGSKTIVLTVIGSGGCEVIKTANINISSSSTILNDTSICKGQTAKIFANGYNTYKWSDGSVTNPLIVNPQVTTTYNLTATYNNGCLSNGSVVVTVNAITVISLNDTSICKGQTAKIFANGFNTYKWSDGSITNPLIVNPQVTTTYNLTATDNNGCLSNDSVVVTVKAITVISLNDTSICKGQTAKIFANGFNTYKWSDGSITNPLIVNPQVTTTYNLTATDNNGCLSNDSVVVTVKATTVISLNDTSICKGQTAKIFANGYNTYKWSDGSITNPLIVNPQVTTTYNLTATDNNGCLSNDSVVVTVNAITVISLNDTSICKGQTAKIFANGFNTYKWSDGSVTNPLIVNPQVTTTYYLTATNSAGCLSNDSVVVTINTITVTPTSNSPVCEGDTLELFASFINNATYKWNGPDNFTSSIQNPIIKNTSTFSTGTYTVILNNNSGCSDTANVIVTVNPKPTITVIPNQITICFGKSVTLTANGASTYSWSPATGLNSITGNSVIASPTIITTTYTVTGIDANGCINYDTVTVNEDTMHVNLGKNDSICPGSTITLDAVVSPATYTWNDNSHSKELSVSKAGTYSVTVTDENNCISSDSIKIFNYPVLKLNLGKNRTIDVDTTIILHAGSGFKTYRWQNGSGDSTYTVNKQGVYWVSVTARNGCTYSDTVDIQVTCYSKSVFIPNVFTPGNSNSICDAYFRLEGRCIGKAELTIFNRWGDKIYWNAYDFSTSMDNKSCDDEAHTDLVGNYNNIYYYLLWDGTDKRNGGSAAEGTYFYVLTYNISNDNLTNKITKKGSVTLLR